MIWSVQVVTDQMSQVPRPAAEGHLAVLMAVSHTGAVRFHLPLASHGVQERWYDRLLPRSGWPASDERVHRKAEK